MFNETVKNNMIKDYGIDLVKDILPIGGSDFFFYFDWSKRAKTTIKFLKGDPRKFEFSSKDEISFEELINHYEFNNPMTNIFGKTKYINDLLSNLDNLTNQNELYIPLKTSKGILWIACGLTLYKSPKNNLKLVFGRVYWITNKCPKAIKYYQKTFIESLTGLFTKEALIEHLKTAKEGNHSFGIFIDIDNFKRINDIFGHDAGDEYLKQLGTAFKGESNESTIFYRYGGDEFFVYMINKTEDEAYKKALSIIYEIETINEHGQQAEVSGSVGIVPIIGANIDTRKVLKLADKAMYHSKDKGKGIISFARDV